MAIKLCQGFDSNLVLQEDIKMSAFKVHNKTARWELGITNLYGSLVVEDFFVLPDASKEEMEEAAKDFESFATKLKEKFLQKRKGILPAKENLRPHCEKCGGDLGGNHLERLEDHRPGCPNFPL
mgnify:FL=1